MVKLLSSLIHVNKLTSGVFITGIDITVSHNLTGWPAVLSVFYVILYCMQGETLIRYNIRCLFQAE